MSIHEIETQMWRWRRRADGLFDSLLTAVASDPGLLFHEEIVFQLETYSNDRHDNPDEWRRLLKQKNKQGATA